MVLAPAGIIPCTSQAIRSLSSTARKFAHTEPGSVETPEGRLPYSVFAWPITATKISGDKLPSSDAGSELTSATDLSQQICFPTVSSRHSTTVFCR